MLIGQLGEQLSKKPTELDQNLKLYSSSDFDSKLSKPNGSIYSTIFSKVVNVSTPVYKLAPDTKYNQVKSSIEHLFPFKSVLEIFLSDLQGSHYLNADQLNEDELFIKPLPVRWLYCGLENVFYFISR